MHKKKANEAYDFLSELSNGKATESVLMRFNSREYELLNRAFNYVPKKRSRHSWLHDVLMSEARRIISEEEGRVIDPTTNLPSEKS